MREKTIIALLLAGGQGSRLGVLTKSVAKPALLYGGKYRIIDFSLSNCINSGIGRIGVLTKYHPLLNAHIGAWNLCNMNRKNESVDILSPNVKKDSNENYKGTANAVYQNINYIDMHSPRYVIILSGDHVYKMDYSLMLDFHIRSKADATISVTNISYNEASRYGIINCCDNGKILEFEEKPANPKSNLASMGIYIFNWDLLKYFLQDDNYNRFSEYDFGRNIIPTMLSNNCKICAYKFNGYWKDVGTVESYWESNMDLIKMMPEFNLFDTKWKIHTANPVQHVHYIFLENNIRKSIVAEETIIYGGVYNSIIFPEVHIGENSVIEDSIIMTGTKIGKNCVIKRCIIGEKNYVGDNVNMGIGRDDANKIKPQIYNSGITVVGNHCIIPDDVMIGKNVAIDSEICPSDFKTSFIPSGESILKKTAKISYG